MDGKRIVKGVEERIVLSYGLLKLWVLAKSFEERQVRLSTGER